MPFADVYRGRRVLITGHTGFKGSWLAEWLLDLGADVIGVALPPPTNPSLFHQLKLESRLEHVIADVRDAGVVRTVVERAQPDFVFHLAAQSLVRESYERPIETYATNVMGTAHVAEALRSIEHPCAAVFVTSDKCYENVESARPYDENDSLGGSDPYSSSKGAAEIAIASWRRSFFARSSVAVASARAGNVVGGGDWAEHRLIPDCVRALQKSRPIPVRNTMATRPWQHVLEPLSGYLTLGANLYQAVQQPDSNETGQLRSAFNFGPAEGSSQSVQEVVEAVLSQWPGSWEDKSDPSAVHEAKQLSLSIAKATRALKWKPIWDFSETISRTVSWYRSAFQGQDATSLTRKDISDYMLAATMNKLAWSANVLSTQ